MSEFSESFHLRSDNQQDGVELLKKAGFKGAVFSPVRGWVTVIPDSGLLEAVEQMAAANKGLLLHYLYAEDHGWQFALYENDNQISKYECGWPDELVIEDSGVNQSAMVKLLAEESRQAEMENILHPEDLEAIIAYPPAYRFANLVGLEHYEWLAGSYLDNVEERDPNVIIVS